LELVELVQLPVVQLVQMVLILYLVLIRLLLLKVAVAVVVQTAVHTLGNLAALEAEAVMMALREWDLLLQQIMDVLELDFLVVLVTTPQVVAAVVLEIQVEKEERVEWVHVYYH
jgi:hypothetical protein